MGANAKEFLRIRVERQHYESMSFVTREKMEVLYTEVSGYDYKDDEILKELTKDYNKANSKKLKREYEIRQNDKKNG